MSAAPTEVPGDDPLDAYRARVFEGNEGIDETVTLDGVREANELLAARVSSLGLAGLRARKAEARRFADDDGISFGPGTPIDDDTESAEGRTVPTEARVWDLDPLPLLLSSREWSVLDEGLRQRARLLDAVLTDLTGEQRLVREGLIPGAAVYGHDGWLPQAEGIRLAGPRQLVLPATDLARDEAGTWRVFADRAQTPSGAGYAMANRRIVARVMPQLHRETELSRLRGWFYSVQRALAAAAPHTDDAPRAVMLSPGVLSETAFDQAFQSTLLGLPLVESEDLTSRDGRIWMRTTSGLTPVDVIVRRVDADHCDQLELRSGSRLGLPGLVESARLGHTAIVNPLGAGLLENPALIPYLPGVARDVLGEDLQLTSPGTWWAGEATHLSHIVTHLSSLVVKPVARGSGPRSIFGWDLTAEQREELAARIQAEPWRWSAQDPLAMSTAPVVTKGDLEPRNVVLRTFAVADEDDYVVMPGGLGRVSVSQESSAVTSLTGAPSKDVWVVAGDETRPQRDREAGVTLLPATATEANPDLLAPARRVASDLYWLGRYAERAEAASRLIRVADNLVDDHAGRPGTTGHAAMTAMLRALSAVMTVRPGFDGDDAADRLASPLRHLRELTLDPRIVGSVAYSAHRAVLAAQAVREQLSLDTWLVMSRLERTLQHAQDEDDLHELLMEVIEALLALAGIGVESLVRDPSWAFTDAGKRMERAQQTIRLLRHTLAVERSPLVEGVTTEATLVATESVITYRRRLSTGIGHLTPAQAAVELLLFDQTNPRSVRFQVDRLAEALECVGDQAALARTRDIGEQIDGLDLDALFDGDRSGLREALVALDDELRATHQAVAAQHFIRKGTQRAVQWSQWSDGGEGW